MNPAELVIRFRKLLPSQQALIVGSIVFVIYWLYDYLFLKISPMAAASESVFSALVFLVVYYLTTVVIMKKSLQAGTQAKGPRKGLRNK
jgi:MFS superfamily sulfate permease-like transporter